MNFNENTTLRQIVNLENVYLFFFYLVDIDVVNGGFKFEKDRIIDDRMTCVDAVHVWSERC